MGWYRTLARPAFLALPPEAAHDVALSLLGLPLPWERIGKPVSSPGLRTTFAVVELANPVGLAAGFDKTGRRVGALGRLGFGYVVAGTFTRRPRRGNPMPQIARDVRRGSMTNAMGLPNPGAEAAAAALARTPRTSPRLASIADEEIAHALEAHALLEPIVDGIELNASCPNVSWGRDRDNERHLATLLRELGARRSRPLLVKLPPFTTDVERDVVLALARIAVEHGADGLTCSNTRRVRDPRLSTGEGGLSGRALSSDTPRIVAEVARATGGAVPIVACGGIHSAADAVECLRAGAVAVQVYTALVFRGPGVVGELTSGVAATHGSGAGAVAERVEATAPLSRRLDASARRRARRWPVGTVAQG
jgi:dihydroorotate dehydrogenase